MTTAPSSLLVVEVGTHRCGFLLDVVVELVRMVATVPVPGAPAVIEGIIDVRGVLVPVVDLRTRLGLPKRAARASDHLVLLRTRMRVVALHVDRAVEIAQVEMSEDAVSLGVGEAQNLAGVARQRYGLLIVHDIDAFVSSDEAAELDAALAALDASEDPPG